MELGNSNRSVGFTKMNAASSRSHSIFSIALETCEKSLDGKDMIRAGKLHLVDLAGSGTFWCLHMCAFVYGG